MIAVKTTNLVRGKKRRGCIVVESSTSRSRVLGSNPLLFGPFSTFFPVTLIQPVSVSAWPDTRVIKP